MLHARLWLLVVLLATLTWSVSVGAQPQPLDSPVPVAGRYTVVIGASTEPDTLHPLFYDAGTAEDVLETLFTREVQLDNNWRPFPQGVEYIPNVKDGTWTVDGERMTLLWKIKPRRWHDGRAVTCADYVFTHKVARDERVPVHFDVRFFVPNVASVSCPKGAGAREIRVAWRQRDAAAALLVLGFNRFMIPQHIVEPFYRSNPSRLGQTPFGFDPKVTIGDGAFRLVDWRKGESITVEAVEGHAIFGPPKVKRIIWRFIPRAGDLTAAVLTGTVDVATLPALSVEAAVNLERQAQGRFKVHYSLNGLLEHIDFNLDHPLLQDVRVRRAIAHGINRTQIAQQLFFGRLPVAHTYWPPRHAGFTEAVPKYPYDPARARALLREAGFIDGPDGIMRDPSGGRLSLELNTTIGTRDPLVRLIQEQLRQAGIEITVVNFPSRVLFTEILPRRRFKAMVLYAFSVGVGGGSCRPRYHSQSIPTEANGWNGGNYSGYRNPEMDEACLAAIHEPDEGKRVGALRQVGKIFSRDLPALPLFYRATIMTAKTGLQNFSIGAPFFGGAFWNAHAWYWQ